MKKILLAIALLALVNTGCYPDAYWDWGWEGDCDWEEDCEKECDFPKNEYAPTLVYYIQTDVWVYAINYCFVSTSADSSCIYLDYTWCCADYWGYKNLYVDLTFKNCGSGYVLDSQYIATGACDDDCI